MRTCCVVAMALALAQAAPVLAADIDPAPMRPPSIAAVSSFQGSYVTVGGAYGISTVRGAQTIIDTGFASFGLLSPAGPSVIGSAGYNLAFQNWMVGIEADGRWGLERAKASNTLTAVTFILPPPGIITRQISVSYDYNSDAAAHVVGRVGGIIGNTLIFGKAGVGAGRITETYTANDPLNGTRSLRLSLWLPSVIFGAGLEQNFGRAFARLGAELEATQTNTSVGTGTFVGFSGANTEVTWTARGTAAAGVRF